MDRVALVTGAGRGIGAAVATRLAQSGHRVVIADVEATAEATAARLRDAGHQARAIHLDVADEAIVGNLPKLLGDWWKDLAVLVNNAGISPKVNGVRRTAAETPIAEWRRVIEVNLTGAFMVSQACMPPMKANRWGRIVMMASQAARMSSAIAGTHYAVSKSGLMSLARMLATELGPHGITVNSIAPGRIVSDMMLNAAPGANEAYLARIPAGRYGTPEDVANSVNFLASDEASYLNGTTIDVGGGSFMP